jgi:hypothetical protein
MNRSSLHEENSLRTTKKHEKSQEYTKRIAWEQQKNTKSPRNCKVVKRRILRIRFHQIPCFPFSVSGFPFTVPFCEVFPCLPMSCKETMRQYIVKLVQCTTIQRLKDTHAKHTLNDKRRVHAFILAFARLHRHRHMREVSAGNPNLTACWHWTSNPDVQPEQAKPSWGGRGLIVERTSPHTFVVLCLGLRARFQYFRTVAIIREFLVLLQRFNIRTKKPLDKAYLRM